MAHRYGSIPLFVFENGVWDTSETLDDESRSKFVRNEVAEVLKGQR